MGIENPKIQQYANQLILIPWNIPVWVSRLLFYIAVCLTSVVILSATVTEYLNYHFDDFFPRKTYGSGDASLPFKPDQFVNEDGWRSFRAMGSGNMDYYWKPLSAANLAEMKMRTSENGLWNFFVGLVKWGTFPELAAIVVVFLIAIALNPQKNRHATWGQWRMLMVCIGLGVVVVLVVLGQGYVPAILE